MEAGGADPEYRTNVRTLAHEFVVLLVGGLPRQFSIGARNAVLAVEHRPDLKAGLPQVEKR